MRKRKWRRKGKGKGKGKKEKERERKRRVSETNDRKTVNLTSIQLRDGGRNPILISNRRDERRNGNRNENGNSKRFCCMNIEVTAGSANQFFLNPCQPVRIEAIAIKSRETEERKSDRQKCKQPQGCGSIRQIGRLTAATRSPSGGIGKTTSAEMRK